MCNQIDIEKFLKGPLVTWFKSCFETFTDVKLTYDHLLDGVLINNVFLQMEIQAVNSDITSSLGDPCLRLRNLQQILSNISRFYLQDLGLELPQVPDIRCLAREPQLHVSHMETLLTLLLGCAVQCPNNGLYVERIKLLDEQTQDAIANYIIQATRRDSLLSLEPTTSESLLSDNDSARETRTVEMMLKQEKKCVEEILKLKSKIKSLGEFLKAQVDDLIQCKDELKRVKIQYADLQKEHEKALLDAKNASVYRDLLDVVSEKAEKIKSLEQENERMKEKLNDYEFLETRVEELEEQTEFLEVSKDMLLEETFSGDEKDKRIHELEKLVSDLEEKVNNFSQQSDIARRNYEKINQENRELERILRATRIDVMSSTFVSDVDESSFLADMSLSEQITNSDQSRVLMLEVENRRLTSLLDSQKEEKEQLLHKYEIVKQELEEFSKRYESVCKAALVVDEERESLQTDTNRNNLINSEKTCKRNKYMFEEEHNQTFIIEEAEENNEMKTMLKMSDKSRANLSDDQKNIKTLYENLIEKYQRVTRKQGTLLVELNMLKEDFKELYILHEIMTAKHQSEINRLMKTANEGLRAKNLKIIELQVEIAKLKSRYEVVKLMSESKDSERNLLNDYTNHLVSQNMLLLNRSKDDQDFYHREDLKKSVKINELYRQKDKLEEKLMENYRRLEQPKKRRTKDDRNSFLIKMRRASSDFFKLKRRSWAEESNAAEKTDEFEFTRGCEFDFESPDSQPRPGRSEINSDFGLTYSAKLHKRSRPFKLAFNGERAALTSGSRRCLEFDNFFTDSISENQSEGDLDSTLTQQPFLARFKSIDLSDNESYATELTIPMSSEEDDLEGGIDADQIFEQTAQNSKKQQSKLKSVMQKIKRKPNISKPK